MAKSREMQEMVDALATTAFGWDGNKSHCRTCNAPTGNPHLFRDDLSRREYRISGMCQKCQDSVFCEEEL